MSDPPRLAHLSEEGMEAIGLLVLSDYERTLDNRYGQSAIAVVTFVVYLSFLIFGVPQRLELT